MIELCGRTLPGWAPIVFSLSLNLFLDSITAAPLKLQFNETSSINILKKKTKQKLNPAEVRAQGKTSPPPLAMALPAPHKLIAGY